jgi:hypothetical protein
MPRTWPSRVRIVALSAAVFASLTSMAMAMPAAEASNAIPAPSHPVALAKMSPDAIAKRQRPLLAVADEIIQLTSEGRRAGYGGYGDVAISVPDRTVTLYWKGALPSGMRKQLTRLRAQAPVRVVSAPYTWQQLQAQVRQLFAHRAELSARGVALSQAGPAPDATGVRVGVDYRASKAVATAHTDAATTSRQAVEAVGSGPAPVTVTDVPMAHATGSRDNDANPFWGGSRIVRSGNWVCTNGFSIWINGYPYMLTAGHCGGISTNWETTDWYGSGNEVGHEVNRNPNGDTAIISVPGNERMIYDKGWNASVGEAVVGARQSVPGSMVCTEGATSGVICAIKVMNTGLTTTFTTDTGTTFTAANEVYAYNTNFTQASAGGDSGGPVIMNTATPGQELATGTISGGSNSVSCRSTNDPYVTKKCYNDVYYEDIYAALYYWGASL